MGNAQLWKGYIISVGPNFSIFSKIQNWVMESDQKCINWCESKSFTQKTLYLCIIQRENSKQGNHLMGVKDFKRER